MTQTLISTT